ncbi:hypothetical protein [Micromonospora sp. CPCC 206061]|jgi:hypothetical protein|uniref:hypothetical protein n=1 Tax=Micromonospora sp. CPCC 206061 TaxID=3122410 RepID=UPI002FF19457
MSTSTPHTAPPAGAEPVRRAWARPAVQCLDVRPEVTAYAGGGTGPWQRPER